MKGVVKTLKPFYVWAFLLVGFISGFFVYAATIDTTVYTPEELVIIPSEVSSDSWQGLEYVLSQDVHKDSLWQDFSTTNSAFLPEANTTESENSTTSNSTTDDSDESYSEPAKQTDEADQNAGEINEAAPASSEAEVVPEPEPESVPVAEPEPEPEPDPEPTAQNTNDEGFVHTVLATIIQAFPFAQQTVEEVPSNPEPTVEPESIVTEEEPPAEPDEVTTDENQPEQPVVDVVPEESEAPPAAVPEPEPVHTEDITPTPEESLPDFVLTPCEVALGCERHSMTFTGFTTPDFETVTTLDSVQLRLSLGAKERIEHATKPQRFVVEYTYASGTAWEVASVLDIDDELTNSINGDYFLTSLALPANFAELANLQVRVSYEGDRSGLEGIFIESVWLEVNAGSFYETGEKEEELDTLNYERELLAPHLHELDSPDLDPALSTLPSFTLSYDPQQNFFKRIFNSLFSENTYVVDRISLADSAGNIIDVPFDITYREDTTWTLSMLKQPQKLKPGKYTVTVEVLENEIAYVDTFEFYWGVLAVNPKKSMYFPNEEVEIHMAALTDTGDTICDADLTLTIIDPKNNVFEVPIEHSSECGANNVTDIPDYTAHFTNTGEWGEYTMQLENRNKDGEVVHKVHDTFEVREYIPFDIERTAPTRIYPPAPYDVKLKITAYRDFKGDINERVPRGFAIDGIEGALISTLPEYSLITWKDVEMKEGDVLELSYQFDAPDVSPYMYLLGPLDMDGFAELRQWQIASDALSGIGWFTGTRTVAGTNINGVASPLEWSTSSVDAYYFTHSTSSGSERVTLRQDGDYYIAVTLPQNRTDGNNSRTRVGVEVRVNGVAVPDGLGRSSLIDNVSGHAESSAQDYFLLTGIHANDYVEVYTEGIATIDVGDIVNVTGKASLYLEYIDSTANVFAATTTRTASSTNLNLTATSALLWTETRQDSDFVHSDAVNPENITISNAGAYMVDINIPLTGDTTQQNIIGRVRLNGVQVAGGEFKQGYLLGEATESDADSSIHWSGVVVSTSSNQVLTVTTEREGNTGTTTVTTGFTGSIFIQTLATTSVAVFQGTNLVGGTNWNPAARAGIQWDTRPATMDSTVYTHSTSTNSHQITINQSGDYYLAFNDAVSSGLQRSNHIISVDVGSTTVSGAQSKSHYIRNQNGNNESSGALVYLLEGVTAGQIVTVYTAQEALVGTVNDTTSASLLLWKKASYNARPAAPTMFDTPFNNIRLASTTPYFEFKTNDSDGTSDIQYQFSISTTSNFAASTTRTSGIDSGFVNTASSSDTSPFTEDNKIGFQLQSGDALTDLYTYYWRVRARDVTGSGGFGDWSTTQSLSVNMSATVPNWYQTYTGQFTSNTLVGAVSSGDDRVQVDSGVNTEILIAYGDGTNNTPRYRLWTGTSWDTQQNANAVGGTINWVRTAAGVTRDEYVLLTLDQSSSTYAQIYNATSTSWSTPVLLSSAVNNLAHKGIAVGYESLSGDAMAVSCSNGASPVYRIWNGSSWSATSSISVSSLNNCSFLEIASDPASDEMILVVRDSGATVGSNYEALVWDGSSWIANRVIGSVQAGQLDRSGIGLAYEASGQQAIIAVTDGTQPRIAYTIWDGSTFSTNNTQAVGNDFEFGHLVSDDDSDDMALCYVDEDTDSGVLTWNGGGWQTFQEIELTPNSNTGRPIDCTFETSAGRSDNLLINYSDTVNNRYQVYSGTWPATEQTVTGIEDTFWVQTERADDGTIVMVAHDDFVAGDQIESSYWNGTSWSTKQLVVPNPSSVIAAPYETFEMAAKRFQYRVGVVTSAPISFSFVPNRSTWGDLSFSTSEPFGTDVKVKLKYTSTSTCDSYIPNGALPGNTAGFDVGSSTLNISGLSTTTYSQICLEATITTLGSESASLVDWSVTWLREAQLIQNNYRWYTNGSFLTPTDPWPLGVTDSLENTALAATEAVNINDVIRLRMSLQGSNVSLATSTKIFKLQYAEGQTCTPLLAWTDVGAPASTTALWRGYENSIVGSDWLSSSWLRRTKITVDKTQVGEAVTSFPVYVNLDDLPDSFFANTQSDGDDIRITTSDGITELPFDLVSINTSTKVGELHFKATLSTSTNSEFYIYYGNASASGYSASATYGSRNVWTNSYAGVYHMNQDPAGGSAPQILDSTANARHASRTGTAGVGRVVAAQLGSGLDFVGTAGDYTIDFPSFGIGSTGSYTYSAWFKAATTTNGATGDGNGTYMVDRTGVTNELVGLKVVGGNYSHQYRYDDSSGLGGVTGGAATANSWRYVTWGRSYNSNRFITVNNVRATTTDTTSALTPPLMRMGGHQSNTNFTGLADEVRIASVARSSGWTTTEFNNQSNTIGFYSISAEELIGDGRSLPSTVLTGSDYAETYEEQNPTGLNRNAIAVGNDAEWDFTLQNYGGAPDTEYCFRMVYQDGSTFNTYTQYPELITNAPPPAPTLVAPFDNEQSASTTPWFEFFTDDALSDEVSYQIEIDNNYDFGSVTLGRESNANFTEFTNLSAPSERGLYTTGNTIQFIANSALSSGTYYWRVRAKDDNGSGAYGEWSTPYSFTIASTSITTWLQTTGEQFNTNNLLDAQISTSTNDVGILTSFTAATTTSTAIDYDDKDTGNAWGQFTFTHNVTSGSIRYYIEYNTGGNEWALVPDSALSGNSSGFTSSPVSLAGLNTVTYNEIRIMAVMLGTPSLPRLLDWKVEWGETIEVPTIVQPFDNAKTNSTVPELTFNTTDPQVDDLQYEVQLSSTPSFTASSTYLSGVDAGFTNVTNGADTSPFTSGNTIKYTVQSALTNGSTYWWRVRARDPGGTNVWSSYNDPQSFTVDTSSLTSTWFQTTGDQFATDDLTAIETPSGGAQITSVISEVMSVYGEGTGQSPQYRLWNGATWSNPESAETVDSQIRWTRLKAAPTRPEYVLGTLGTDLDINFQVFDGVTQSWGNMFELYTESVESTKRRFDLAYETTSGDLIAVGCVGSNAVYSIWNGTSWSATSTISLVNTNACEWVQLTSDPVSDEIVALFRNTSASSTDFEALVWNGSSWGNSKTLGDISNNAYEGMAVNYEESGGQAVVVVSNNTLASFLWTAWNGSSWTTATATAIGNDFYWASLKRDVGTDRMALCYVDLDNDVGVILWDGSSWNTFSEIDQNNNNIAGRGVDCEYETLSDRDGDIVIPYSDGVLTRYQTYSYASSSFSTEADLSTMNDGFYMQTVRGGDGTVHVYTLDDASNPDRYDTSRWDGSTWSTLSNFSTNPSITATPFNGSITMAAQIFPNFTEGSIRSTPIEFSSGNSPQWERVRWNDTTPGASDIKYRVYYETATGSYALIPDSVLAGNAAGFTDSPVSISAVDRTTYDTLKLDAELTCSSGNCPSIQDWSVEWSQGITISGSALDYDQLTAISTGTIAVAVNGVLQVGKSASLGSGTTTQQMVFDTAGTSTFTVPAGVTNVTVKAWGAGGGAGGGGASDAGGTGAGAGFVQGNFTVIPAESLSIRVGGGGTGGSLGVPPGAGGGGGYSGVLRSSTPLAIAGGGGGGGGGTGGVQYVSAGTACAVSGAGCTPTIPAGTATNDVYIAVLHSRTNTAHTCTANCTGWTEFSTQAGSAGEGRLSVWWYRQSGAAPGNPSFGGPATDSYSGRIWVYRGVTTSGNPYDVLGSNTAVTGATTTFAGSSLISNVADAMVVHVAGTMDDNTWGPGSGSCTIPNSVNANFYTANLNGNDNSISLCYKEYPLAAAGNLGTPINTQVANSPDVGRYFTFALKPNASGIMAAGNGGVGGGLSGTAGGNASTTTGGGGGTQSAGGTAGGGSATIGSAYTGGSGNSGTGGGAGGAGGTNGGGAGGTGNLGTLAAAGGGGGAGYYGGGGANSASGAYIAGAGGGGGSSYLAAATATSTQSGTTTQAGNNGDGDYVAGVGVGNTSATSSNGGNGGAGRVVISWSTANVPGSWSIPNVSAFAGDVITVFMQGATGTAEAVGVTKYDGVGDITGMQLSKRHLTIGSNDAPVISNTNLGLYDSADTEDIFFSVTGSDVLNLCVEGTCGDARLRILASSTYQPGANGAVINFQNNGTFAPATNTLRVSGAWQQMATFTPDTSTIIFTATTSSSTLQNATTSYVFHNVTFGETSGAAIWNLTKPLDITGTLGIDYGTLARGTSTINLEQNLRIGSGGFITGLATTTFDGSGSNTWTDTTASTTNLGRVVIDGTAKTITLGGNVAAETVTIGADDTLNASGSGFNINVYGAWINNNAFIPQAGTVTFVGTSSNTIVRGTSAFNNLTFSGVGGVWSFSSSTLALNGNLTIATGTVTLPSGTTTIGGSFLNTGGTFAHNNGEVRMTSTAGGRSITQRAGTFLNAFYDLVFSGSGSWSYTESAATTTRNMNILSGTVTLASSTLTVGGDFNVSGSGAFAHNNGELILLVSNSNTLRTNGSSLNNLRTRGGSGSWYNASWTSRKPIVINASQVSESLTDFPVFVDMANLGSDFFSTVKSDGGDIRVTTSDGVTEVPIEVVAINTGGQSGELHFKAPSLSTSSNSTFYVYYGNSTASGYATSTTYGARNVWTNNYAAVYHLNQDPTGSGAIILDSTVNARHGTRSGTAAVGRLVAAKVGTGLNMVGTAGDYAIDFPSPGIGSTASYTFSAWFKSGTISNGLNNDGAGTYMFDRTTGTNDLAGIKIIGGNYAHQFRYGDGSGIGSVDGAAASSTGWQNVVWGRSYNSNRFIYVDKVGVTTGDSATALTPPAPRLGGHQSNTIYDGIADEFRIASVARTSGWISTEYNNQASTTAFYSVSAAQARFARTFSDTNATILGNFILETGGDATFPSGTLSVGGSFDNDATFAANSGTVRFNSTAGAETIAVGTSSSFATLEFNSAGGNFTVTENATATVAINLTQATQFTLQSGRVLAALGSFTNAASGSSTTWTGSVLVIANSGSSTLNAKGHGGDVYGTLRAASSTTVKMWNSSATTYETIGTSSAIYSQDHAAIDGNLYIFGNYLRTTGIEYWSYGTDFDGIALTASTSRQVNVRVSTSSTLGFVGATLNMSGTSSASTTIDSQTGSYSMSATNTTIVAQYFTMTGTDAGGLRLNASTTLSTFQDGFFTVIPGRTGITISSTTINTNPSAQYFRIGFATTTAGTASNVTLNGSSSNFIWFRTGTGNLYGEAYDANDANPGSIRFDDSSNSITVSGVVYSNDGITIQGAPTCNGTTPNVRLVVDGGTYTASTTCNAGTGAYTFNNVTYTGDPKIIVYLNTNGGVLGSAITKTPTANITNMNIYANRVITRHQDVLPLTISDMVAYDYDNDTDISFTAATGSPNTLILRPNTELFVFASTTFAPGGNITLQGNANSNSYEGTLQLGASSTFTAAGTETHTLAGRLVARPSSLLTAASSTFVFNATTSGKSITASSSLTFNQLQFNGVGGGWNITSPIVVDQSMTVTAGAVSGTSDITIQNGSLSGNGMVSMGAGTTTLERTNTLGGTTAWTFYNLKLGNGSVVGTTTPAGTATTTILGRLTINNAHFLKGNSSLWNLNGSGTVFVETGNFLEDTTLVRYTGANANILGTTYYDLRLDAAAGSSTFTGSGSGISVLHDLTVGGTASTTANFTTSDPVLAVTNDVLINSNGTLIGSDSASFTIAGSYDNNGTFVGSGGTVSFISSGSKTIAAGNSSFSSVTINGTGSFTVSENATATNAFTLINHANFTVSTSTTLSVGGQFTNTLGGGATTWTGSTLSLYGSGSITINASTTNDVYGTLSVGTGRRVRMWNSSASTYTALGGIYSQDHGGTDGLLHIYGTFTETSANDYWSYSTDFDGTPLTGGSARAVSVRAASGTAISYNGGSLSVVGTTSASTTIQNQASGTYSFAIGATASTTWNRVVLRDTNSSGIIFSGTPNVNDFSYTDHLVSINNASAITVGGTVIDANQAKNFTNNNFDFGGGVTGAVNVTATGTSVSSWRFTNHTGNLDGEAFDVDPGGDPGYIVWADSAALITISGNVYSDEGSTVSTVCDGSTNDIVLRVAGLTTYTAFCNATSGAYTIPSVSFSPNDTLTLYIDGKIQKAATVTVDPVSTISNMHLYENRVIVRTEGTDPISILDMSVWDSSDDADIPFTAIDSSPDTLSLPADRKLLIWNGKTFAPGGNMTLSGGGAGAAYDGTLEAQTNAVFRAVGTEAHSIGGSIIFGTGAVFTAGQSTTTFTTSGAARTVDVNSNNFYNAAFTGSGSWTITDTTTTFANNFAQSNGTITFGTGTTTVGRSFNATGGAFTINGSPLNFISTTTGNIVRFDDSPVAELRFGGTGGSWSMTDTNATTTHSFTLASGTVSLPSGNFGIGKNFRNTGGTITHNTADVIMTATTTALLRASSSDLYAVRFTGAGPFTMEDVNITLLDTLAISSGTVTFATGTLSVGGSLTVTSGGFNHASGTVLFNASAVGKSVSPSTSSFYNVQVSAPSGGYTFSAATTTNNFTLASANTFVLQSGATLAVGGVFTNSVGGAATTFTGSTVSLTSATNYSINSRTTTGDTYGTLRIGADTDIRLWNSSSATTTVATSGSLYSQDNGNVNGALYIYGDFGISTTTEYWNYAIDFDGTSLTGTERQVTVYMAQNATTTLSGGTLQILGNTGSTTNIRNQATGTYAFSVTGGTLNANYYSFDDLNAIGLSLSGTPTITELSNGYFDLSVATGSLITLSSTTLNANASKIFTNVGFNATNPLTGYNVNLSGSTINAWRFSASYGNFDGEAFDVDGVDACGSIRFDDSSCLLTEQTHARWRYDNGTEGAPNSEWFNSSWDYRKRVRFVNTTSESAATTAVKMTVTYDSDMQTDFEDLRFTGSDGITPLSYWIEKVTPSTDAVVWVKIPSLPADDTATVFMYYGTSTAPSNSSGTSTFNVFDDFEDNNITEYSGDTSLFQTDTSPVYGGTYALEAANTSGRTTDGIYRTAMTASQGEVIRWMQYINTSTGSGDEACTLFGIQSPGANNNNYAVCLEQFGVDRITLAKNVVDNDISGTVLATTTVTYATGWYEVEVDWKTNNTIKAYLYNSAGTLVGSTTATDSSYTTGGLGFTFWFQHGSWDSYTSRARGGGRPTVYFGAEQTDGGATWASALDTAGSAFQPGEKARLRIAVENSGLSITNQQFQLEYAAKGAAPSCESVATANFAAVPNQASCGSSAVCMATSSYLADGDASTDLLFDTSGTFTPGKLVESPSSKTTAFDVNQNYYTELEYVITPTVNASDALCFRVSNNGTALDFYGSVAELGLRFDPVLGSMTLNGGSSIVLTPGTTTLVYATGTVTDFNGYTDLTRATTTFYRSGVGAACSANTNSCYISTTATSSCSFQGCSGNSCTLSCVAHVYYNADPTDIETYVGQEWLAFVEVEDVSAGYDFTTTPGVELMTLRALDVNSSINYGSLQNNQDTGSTNSTSTVSNLGNDSLDVNIEATDLTSGVSYIPASQEKFATSTFTYSSCTTCTTLSSSSLTNVPLDLPKPTVPTPLTTDDLFWGIYVPLGALPTAHQGVNTFYAIGD